MEYPGSHFRRGYRLALLAVAILIFFGLLPFVILYSAGYRLNLKSGWLRAAGGLSFDAIKPNNTEVFLNEIKIQDTFPIRLKNITPRAYSLRLFAPGYHSFEKLIAVRDQTTVYIKEINLIKQAEPKLIFSGDLAYLTGSADGKWLAYVDNSSRTSSKLMLANAADRTARLLYKLPKKIEIKLSWSKAHSALALATGTLPYKNLTIVSAAPSGSPFNLGALVGAPVEKFAWNDELNPALYIATAKNLFFFSLSTKQLIKIGPKNFGDWYVAETKLWTVNEIFTTSTGKKIILTKDALGFSSQIALPENDPSSGLKSWRFLDANGDTALVRATSSNFAWIVNHRGASRLDALFATRSRFNNHSILWSPSEAWLYAPGTPPMLLSRTGDRLLDLYFLDKFDTLALMWDNKISIFFPSYLVATDIAIGQFTGLTPDLNNKILYFTGTINNQTGLWSLAY
ncbi:MAG: hypothetical protein Q7K39_01185 [Candidatus Magasanikbacteria bacterium]|nr:hypothetical protein [Candidatus Magasanikbacteria bacterium]